MGAQKRNHQTLIISLEFIYENTGKEISDSLNNSHLEGVGREIQNWIRLN